MMASPRIAIYARVSTDEQSTTMQVDELTGEAARRGWTVCQVVTESTTGAATGPGLRSLLDEGLDGTDVLFVWRLDRLARSLTDLIRIVERLRERGVGLASLHDPYVDTTTPGGRFSLQILGAVAELERSIIRERVKAGLRAARAAGVRCGRPEVQVDLRPAVAMLERGHSLKGTAAAVGLSRTTLRRRLAEAGEWPRDGG